MALYNRVRILVLESRRFGRDGEAAHAEYGHVFDPLGARYAGRGSSNYGNSGCHMYLIDDPTDAVLAQLLVISMKSRKLEISREYRGGNPVDYSLEDIVTDIARTLAPNVISTALASSEQMDVARCWSGVKVMETMIESLAQCCAGGAQWGHNWSCPTLP